MTTIHVEFDIETYDDDPRTTGELRQLVIKALDTMPEAPYLDHTNHVFVPEDEEY